MKEIDYSDIDYHNISEVILHSSSTTSVLFKGPLRLMGRMGVTRLKKNAVLHKIHIQLGSESTPSWRGAVSSVFPNINML